MKTEYLSLRFGGENDIDLETLAESLNSTVNVLQEIADSIIEEDTFCKFKVKNIEPGSFVINLESLVQGAQLALMNAPTIIAALNGILSIRKHLNGEIPKNVNPTNNGVEITSCTGENLTINNEVYNIYVKNPQIERNLAEIVDSVKKDGTRSSIQFITTTAENISSTIEISKDEFEKQSKIIDVESLSSDLREDTINTILNVVKADFVGGTQWTFMWQGKKVNANIEDQEFLHCRNEFLFGPLTTMRVDLRIRSMVNPDGTQKPKTKSTYSVLKVYEVDQN